jgi:hypothetical protein
MTFEGGFQGLFFKERKKKKERKKRKKAIPVIGHGGL